MHRIALPDGLGIYLEHVIFDQITENGCVALLMNAPLTKLTSRIEVNGGAPPFATGPIERLLTPEQSKAYLEAVSHLGESTRPRALADRPLHRQP